MRQFALSLLLLLPLLSFLPAQDAPPEARGRVEEVTLYRGQALVTRVVPLPEAAGVMELVVVGLPAAIQPTSLYAEPSELTEVRAVRYRTRAVDEVPRDEVREILLELDERRNALAVNQSLEQVLQQRLQMIARLEAFVAGTGKGDLEHGVLDAEALERIVRFAFEQREEAQGRILETRQEARELQERIAFLERRLNEVRGQGTETAREAVLFLEKEAGADSVRLSYVVGGCGWSPSYNVRARSEAGEVIVEYDALIQQRTGEDWNGVDLSLSTATPSLAAAGPSLAPFDVVLAAEGVHLGRQGLPTTEAYKTAIREQTQAQTALRNAVSMAENMESNWSNNRAATGLQTMEIVSERDTLDAARRELRAEKETPNLDYEIDGRVSLASRNDQQMVRITRARLEGEIDLVATPVLTRQVFREAQVVNTSGVDFLTGPVSAYLDRRFVGRTELPTVTRGEHFLVGLGADPQLRAHREVVDRKERVQGGNRVIDVTIALRIENFDEAARAVRLLGRLPHSDQSDAIRVTPTEPSKPLSEDPNYVRTEKPLGILRWDLEVPGGATGEEALEVTYGFRLEFAKNATITNPTGGAETRVREAFEQLLKQRGVR